ncbi:hypothetical protein LDP80_21185 [Klebsiella michiganensis]|nr:hypothetical protein [Klebsiella michiganensis]UDV50238.1 hypothetical protein LJU40_07125 [Klebsiella michiganensis]ULF61270.1 hypothetical protein LDP80_21185 [Klebsiella michiganensis]ULF67138.1 hypothetical protein LD277_21185 [Klebsiella michiganensis]
MPDDHLSGINQRSCGCAMSSNYDCCIH